MHKIQKGQVRRVKKSDVRAQNQFIDRVFGLVRLILGGDIDEIWILHKISPQKPR